MNDRAKTWTILNILDWGKSYFLSKGIESPRLTIELLLSAVLGLERIQLYSNFEKPLTKDELTILRSYVLRCANHEPIQYILRQASFYGLQIELEQGVLIPRPETEILADECIKIARSKGPGLKILDIGTGSGCIAAALAYNLPDSMIHAIDNSDKAVEIASGNASRLSLSNIKIEKYDIFTGSLHPEKYDIIVSNPPYIPADEYRELDPGILKFEPAPALTDNLDGLSFYRRFASIFNGMLTERGVFLLEIGYGQAEKIRMLFEEKVFKINVLYDFSGIERIFIGSKIGC